MATRFYRPRRRRVSVQEWRLMLLGGVLLGLVVARMPMPDRAVTEAAAPVAVTGSFGLCHTGAGIDCVVDGDTAWIAGEKVRLADIDAPETHPPRCAAEADLGGRATRRLQALLNAGPVTLADAGRSHDRYGRRLAVVTVGGESVGDRLVAEGLARRWEGRRRPWCDQE